MGDWKVRKLGAALGAEIIGGNLALAGTEEIDLVKGWLAEHHVIFFPGQTISVEEHVELGKHFGELEDHPNLKNPFTQHPYIFELAATQGGVADEWHTDITFQEEPSIMSILHMVKCPEIGGDTMWTNLYQAYEEMSVPMQTLCEGITALHDALPHSRPDKMAIHPVVRIHPETGRKLLYVNEHFTRRIVEMSAGESEVLLKYLTEWVKNPRFTVRYQWAPGTIAMWDNRCTQHFVVNDFEGERVIQRVTVMGDRVDSAREPMTEPWVRSGYHGATSRHDKQLRQFLRGEKT